MKRLQIPYSIAPTVVVALVAAAAIGTTVDSAAAAAFYGRPAAMFAEQGSCGSVARVTSSRLAEAARSFRGQGHTLEFPRTAALAHLTLEPAKGTFLPTSRRVHPGFGLVNPRLTNLPPPQA